MEYCITTIDTPKAEIKALKPAVINANGLFAIRFNYMQRRIPVHNSPARCRPQAIDHSAWGNSYAEVQKTPSWLITWPMERHPSSPPATSV